MLGVLFWLNVFMETVKNENGLQEFALKQATEGLVY